MPDLWPVVSGDPWTVRPEPARTREIEARLRESLARENRQVLNHSTTLAALSADGRLVGGVSVSTSYGWLLVKMLWVAEDQRRRGIGRDLMEKAFAFGRDAGCHAAWLDTSSRQARDFYARLGFKVFARLANRPGQEPVEHRRWFMTRVLA